MKNHPNLRNSLLLTTALLVLLAQTSSGAILHVKKANPTAAEPYDNWTTAAADIQTAINYASVGDHVVVAAGLYDSGGVKGYPSGTTLTNRVAITKAIVVRSADNDPTTTIIQGALDPATNGPAAVRCVYLADGASLIGFTLTNGATLEYGGTGYANNNNHGGGAWSASDNVILSNCVITGNFAERFGGGVYKGTLYDCTLRGNRSIGTNSTSIGMGGGVGNAILYNCILEANAAESAGGGAYNSTLYDCQISSNTTPSQGGGAHSCTLYDCQVIGNTAQYGGGMEGGTAYRCTFLKNTTSSAAGAARNSTLYNCLLIGNKGGGQAGGVHKSVLYNCTLVGNHANNSGGGAYQSTLTNCISWANSRADLNNTLSHSLGSDYTTGDGKGNLAEDPLFVSNGSGFGLDHVPGDYRLRSNSPCINKGITLAWMTDDKDLDGKPRLDWQLHQVDMGSYEYLEAGTVLLIR